MSETIHTSTEITANSTQSDRNQIPVTEMPVPTWGKAIYAIPVLYVIVVGGFYLSGRDGMAVTLLNYAMFVSSTMVLIALMASMVTDNKHRVTGLAKNGVTFLMFGISFSMSLFMAATVLFQLYEPPVAQQAGRVVIENITFSRGLLGESYRLETTGGVVTIERDIAATGDEVNIVEKSSRDGVLTREYLCARDNLCARLTHSEAQDLLSN